MPWLIEGAAFADGNHSIIYFLHIFDGEQERVISFLFLLYNVVNAYTTLENHDLIPKALLLIHDIKLGKERIETLFWKCQSCAGWWGKNWVRHFREALILFPCLCVLLCIFSYMITQDCFTQHRLHSVTISENAIIGLEWWTSNVWEGYCISMGGNRKRSWRMY